MSGTVAGAKTCKLRHGEDFHRRVGKLGGNPALRNNNLKESLKEPAK